MNCVRFHPLHEKHSFVMVGNPHLYQVSNRYKPSGTNEVEHLYRARYLVQMSHICTGWSIGPVQMSLPPSGVAGRHLYRVEVPPGTNMPFLFFMFLYSDVFA
jgi:hypothetical protein